MAAKLTQVPISIQPIPILQVTPNNVLPSGRLTPGILLRRHFHPGVSHLEPFYAAISIRMSHVRNPSVPPFLSGCLTPGILQRCHFHPGVSHPESFSAAISTRMSHVRKTYTRRRSTFSECPTSGILPHRHSLLRVSHISNSHP